MRAVMEGVFEMEGFPACVEVTSLDHHRNSMHRRTEIVVHYRSTDGAEYAFRIDLPDVSRETS